MLSYKIIFSTSWMVVMLYVILQTDLLNIMNDCDNVMSSLNWIQIRFKINILIYHEFKTTTKIYEGSQIKFNHLWETLNIFNSYKNLYFDVQSYDKRPWNEISIYMFAGTICALEAYSRGLVFLF